MLNMVGKEASEDSDQILISQRHSEILFYILLGYDSQISLQKKLNFRSAGTIGNQLKILKDRGIIEKTLRKEKIVNTISVKFIIDLMRQLNQLHIDVSGGIGDGEIGENLLSNLIDKLEKEISLFLRVVDMTERRRVPLFSVSFGDKLKNLFKFKTEVLNIKKNLSQDFKEVLKIQEIRSRDFFNKWSKTVIEQDNKEFIEYIGAKPFFDLLQRRALYSLATDETFIEAIKNLMLEIGEYVYKNKDKDNTVIEHSCCSYYLKIHLLNELFSKNMDVKTKLEKFL